MVYSDQLLRKGHDIWNAQMNHRFVVDLADGTLGKAAFKDWFVQKYRFLLDYARTFAVAASKVRDEQRIADLLTVAHGTLEHNIDHHRKFATDYDGSQRESDREGAQATVPRQQRLAHLFERTVQREVALFDVPLKPEIDGGRAW